MPKPTRFHHKTAAFVATLATVLIGAAAAGEPPRAAGQDRAVSSRADWEYPDDGTWAEDFPSCGLRHQSPIDIARQDINSTLRRPLAFHYETTDFTAFNNGHTIELEADEAINYIEARGIKFWLLQFHFHSAAEHRVPARGVARGAERTHGAMVTHLVHQSDTGILAVVARVFALGDANPTVDEIWRPRLRNQDVNVHLRLNPEDLLPRDRSVYQYNGSLTTPPCTQQVRWNVIRKLGQVDQDQVDFFTGIFPLSTRNLQPLNSRAIFRTQ